MKFWDSIYYYQIDTKIEREELKIQMVINEFIHVVAKELGVIKVLNWLVNIIDKLIW